MNSITKVLAGVVLISSLTVSASAQLQSSKRIQEISSNSMMLGQLLQLVYNKGLMNELEILDDQMDKVKKIGQDYQKQMMEMTKANSEMYTKMAEIQKRAAEGDKDAKAEIKTLTAEYYEKMSESQSKTIKDLEEVLLPHQMKRLRQIARQQSFKWMKNSDYFGIPYAMSNELDLSREQKKELKKVTDKIRKEFYEDVAKMRKKSMKKILDALTAEQREKFDDIVGDFYDNDRARQGRTHIKPAKKDD